MLEYILAITRAEMQTTEDEEDAWVEPDDAEVARYRNLDID